jgi:hypothetical protein
MAANSLKVVIRMFTKITNLIKAHPLYLMIILVLLIGMGIWFKDTLGAGLERINRWRFSRTVAAQQAEIKKIQDENTKLTDEIKKAYALGEAKELERDAAYAELAKYGAAAKAAIEAQKEAAKQYEIDKNNIALDVPLFQRCKNLCAERAELGYGCKPNADAYCQQYAGR